MRTATVGAPTLTATAVPTRTAWALDDVRVDCDGLGVPDPGDNDLVLRVIEYVTTTG